MYVYNFHHHHKHQGLDLLIHSVSRVTAVYNFISDYYSHHYVAFQVLFGFKIHSETVNPSHMYQDGSV